MDYILKWTPLSLEQFDEYMDSNDRVWYLTELQVKLAVEYAIKQDIDWLSRLEEECLDEKVRQSIKEQKETIILSLNKWNYE